MTDDEEDIVVIDMKKLAGDSTHARPITWMFKKGNLAIDETQHGPIFLGMKAILTPQASGPMIELGGDPDRPVIRPNVNIMVGPGVDIVCDLNDKFPMESDTYSTVYSSFVIEHIKNSRLKQFISECFRITKPGGVNIHTMPNLRAQCAAMATLEKWNHHTINTIFAGDENPESEDHWSGYHKTGLSPELAVDMFREAGFSEVVVWQYPKFGLEMIIEAWK